MLLICITKQNNEQSAFLIRIWKIMNLTPNTEVGILSDFFRGFTVLIGKYLASNLK
jgi:hypothetical protein